MSIFRQPLVQNPPQNLRRNNSDSGDGDWDSDYSSSSNNYRDGWDNDRSSRDEGGDRDDGGDSDDD